MGAVGSGCGPCPSVLLPTGGYAFHPADERDPEASVSYQIVGGPLVYLYPAASVGVTVEVRNADGAVVGYAATQSPCGAATAPMLLEVPVAPPVPVPVYCASLALPECGGFIYQNGDLRDPVATVPVTDCATPPVVLGYAYPTAGPTHTTSISDCSGVVIGYAQNRSECAPVCNQSTGGKDGINGTNQVTCANVSALFVPGALATLLGKDAAGQCVSGPLPATSAAKTYDATLGGVAVPTTVSGNNTTLVFPAYPTPSPASSISVKGADTAGQFTLGSGDLLTIDAVLGPVGSAETVTHNAATKTVTVSYPAQAPTPAVDCPTVSALFATEKALTKVYGADAAGCGFETPVEIVFTGAGQTQTTVGNTTTINIPGSTSSAFAMNVKGADSATAHAIANGDTVIYKVVYDATLTAPVFVTDPVADTITLKLPPVAAPCPCVKTTQVASSGSSPITITDAMLQAACGGGGGGGAPASVAYLAHQFATPGQTNPVIPTDPITANGTANIPFAVPAGAAVGDWLIGQVQLRDSYNRTAAWNISPNGLVGVSDFTFLNEQTFFEGGATTPSHNYNFLARVTAANAVVNLLTNTGSGAPASGEGTAIMWHKLSNFTSASQIGVKSIDSTPSQLIHMGTCYGVNMYNRSLFPARGPTMPAGSNTLTLITARHNYGLSNGALVAPPAADTASFINVCDALDQNTFNLAYPAYVPAGLYVERSADYVCPAHFAALSNPSGTENIWLAEDNSNPGNSYAVSYIELLPSAGTAPQPIVTTLSRIINVSNTECPGCPSSMHTEASLSLGTITYNVVGNSGLKLKITYAGASTSIGVDGVGSEPIPGNIVQGQDIGQGSSATFTAQVEVVCPVGGYISNPSNSIVVDGFTLVGKAYV